MKIGLPRSMYYYYNGWLLEHFFKNLGCDVVKSPKTNKEIILEGSNISNDEMCLSLKLFFGHVSYLKDKCDYIVIPRIDNYGNFNQTCTNFLAVYDLVNNLFDINILNYDINLSKKNTELKGLIKIGKTLGFDKYEVIDAYYDALNKVNKKLEIESIHNFNKLKSSKKKILLVGHPYNLYDNFIGEEIKKILKKQDVEIIYSDKFNHELTNKLSSLYSKSLYWKCNKEAIGSIKLVESKIDGVIFLTTFPCGPDSLVTELIIRKINIPNLNLIIDEIDSLTGIETRIESFMDILNVA